MKIILPESKLLQIKYSLLNESLVEKDTFVIGSEGGNNDYFHVEEDSNIEENTEDELKSSEVHLDSFKKEKSLAPKIWSGNKLNSRVRLKLLDIADDFWAKCNINWVKRSGIYLTGSICNYNWSKFSDIDVHLVVDFSKINERTDFVQQYFDSKKNEWNNEHDGLKIFGFPVELYVEDINAKTESSGLYDLESNKWVKESNPDDIHSIGLNKYEIKSKVASIATKIDFYYDLVNKTDDDAKLRKLGVKAHKLLDKLKKMRKFGLKRGGESDPLNIVYKCLRRIGRLDDLWEISSKLYDKLNSIG